jgi:hypothetical protein
MRVRIVVSCTDRKSAPADATLQLRNYTDELTARADAWIERISRPTRTGRPAGDLYQGGHWHVVRQFGAIGDKNGLAVEVWVVSAGYGLIQSESVIEPYAATFATRGADSITRVDSNANAGDDAAYWWSRLSGRRRSDHRAASLASLAASDPQSPLLIALSGSYVRAIQKDLLTAAKALADPGLLLLVTGEDRAAVRPFRLPVDARLQKSLGGALGSLNARVVRLLLETTGMHGWEATRIRTQLSNSLAEVPAVVPFSRRPMTDAEIEDFIRDGITAEETIPQTRLLRRLRDNGMACEQKRFGDLYRRVMEGAPG